MIHHVVLMNFHDDVTPEKAQEIMQAIRELKNTISEIKSYTEGVNCSTEGLAKGYTHGFTILFDNEADRDAYLIHEDHKVVAQQKLVPFLKNGLESVLVFDYNDNK